MFIREIWGKFTSFIFWNCEISKSELGKFIPNFPLKHVITSTNIEVAIYQRSESNCLEHF